MGTFKFEGKELYYKIKGKGPSVLFVHGWVSDHKRVEKFTNALVKAGYKVILIDLPSFGKTTLRAFKVKRLITILESLMTHLKTKEYHCVGVSLGASVCSGLAVQDKRIKSFVAMVPVVDKQNTTKFFLKTLIKTIKKRQFTIREYVTNLARETTSKEWPKNKIEKRVNEVLSQRRDGYLNAFFWGVQTNCGENIKKLGKKCLVIAGELDVMTPIERIKNYTSNIISIKANHSNIKPQQLYKNKKNIMVNFFDQFELSKLS